MQKAPFASGGRGFAFHMFHPTSDHFSYFDQRRSHRGVSFMVQTFQFPCDLHEIFEQIEPCTCGKDVLDLFIPSAVSRKKQRLNQFGKQSIDFFSKRVFGQARESLMKNVPQLVRLKRFLKHRRLI